MTTNRVIAATETDPGAPLVSALFKALANNVIAAFEGDATAVAAGVTLKDPALDTGVATAAGITWVGLRTASLALGAVGSYGLLRFNTLTSLAAGLTTAGSGLRFTNATGGPTSIAPAGTWRLMGQTTNASIADSTSVFLRIS